MIVDSPALLGILFAEADRQRYAEALVHTAGTRLSAFDDLFGEAGVTIEPVTPCLLEQAHLARWPIGPTGEAAAAPRASTLATAW